MNDAVIQKTADGALYGGTLSAFTFWGLSMSELAVVVSMCVAVLGFIVHTWSTLRRDRRERERHEAVMAELLPTHKEVHDMHDVISPD